MGGSDGAGRTVALRELEGDLVIGSRDAPGYTLSVVEGVAVDGTGRVYVAQPMDRQVRVYDRDGRFVRTIGRGGGGLEEFQHLTFIGLAGDSLWAIDPLARRISFFDTSGRFLSSVRLPPLPGDGMGRPLRPFGGFRDGSLIATTGWGNDLPDEMRICRADAASQEVTDTVARFRDGLRASYRVDFPGNHGFLRGPNPFFDGELWRPAPDGSAVFVVERQSATDAAEASYGVTKLGVRGDTLYACRVRYAPRPIPKNAVGSIATDYVDRIRGYGVSLPVWEVETRVRDALNVPDFERPVTGIAPAVDGSLRIGREASDPRFWDVFDADGELVARVAAPGGTEILLVDGDFAWAVEHDELEVPYVVRYRIVRRPGARGEGPDAICRRNVTSGLAPDVAVGPWTNDVRAGAGRSAATG